MGETNICSALDQQFEDYRSMHKLNEEQGEHIVREDLPALDATFDVMQLIMDRIRLRQGELGELPSATGNVTDSQVISRIKRNRSIILKLMELRDKNEMLMKRLLSQTRSELRQFGQARQAAKGYRWEKLKASRFYDRFR